MFEQLRRIRNEKAVTAKKMSELLGLETEAAYYKKETGTVKFSLQEAKAIADYFHQPIEEIFFASELSK